MTAHMPPVPPDQQPKHGTDADKASPGSAAPSQTTGNTAEQGRTANTQQNTTHQGHQQDR